MSGNISAKRIAMSSIYQITERQVRNKVLKELKKRNIFVMSLSDKFMSGYPDLLCIKPNIPKPDYFFIELKRPGKTVSKIQEYTHSEIRLRGGVVYVISCMEQLLEIL
jgi:hypothetical protein